MTLNASPRWYGEVLPLDTRVYRHTGAHRLEQLLRTRRVHFARLDSYHHQDGDPLEGRHSAPMRRWFKDMARGTVNERWAGTDAIDDNERRLFLRTAASCWTLDAQQPLSAWRRWRLGPGDVRLATTLGGLLATLRDPRLALGAVRYLNHDSEWISQRDDIVHLAFAKDRDRWGWEQEFRLALAPDPRLSAPELPAAGVDVALRDLAWLDGVTMHPASSRAHRDSVMATLSRAGLPSSLAS